MNFRKCSSALPLLFVIGATMVSVGAQKNQPPAALPSLADLQKLNYVSTSRPAGAPTYDDLQGAIHLIQLFHQGSPDVADWQWSNSGQTRGPRDAAIYSRAVSAVVYIFAATGEPDAKGKVLGMSGAGAILYPDDLVLTNWHVVRGAVEGNRAILVYLKPARGSEKIDSLAYKGHVQYFNKEKDLALIHFDQPPPYELTKMKFGKMSTLAVGEDVHVIGHPQGNTWSYSTGVISQIREGYRATIDEDGVMQPFQADVLQLQTSINPGNSGGPVLDDNADIIGLVSHSAPHTENLHYAIAVDELASFMDSRDKWAASQTRGGIPNAATAKYSQFTTTDGQQVIKVEYPDGTAFLLMSDKGKVQGMVADAGDGAFIEAWAPTPDGRLQQWRATFADGKMVEGSGENGQPTRFVAH
jgi:S1-C subfamily serine protease